MCKVFTLQKGYFSLLVWSSLAGHRFSLLTMFALCCLWSGGLGFCFNGIVIVVRTMMWIFFAFQTTLISQTVSKSIGHCNLIETLKLNNWNQSTKSIRNCNKTPLDPLFFPHLCHKLQSKLKGFDENPWHENCFRSCNCFQFLSK